MNLNVQMDEFQRKLKKKQQNLIDGLKKKRKTTVNIIVKHKTWWKSFLFINIKSCCLLDCTVKPSSKAFKSSLQLDTMKQIKFPNFATPKKCEKYMKLCKNHKKCTVSKSLNKWLLFVYFLVYLSHMSCIKLGEICTVNTALQLH